MRDWAPAYFSQFPNFHEYFYLKLGPNDERANSELTGAMTPVGDDYDYQAAIDDIQHEHIRLFRGFRERDALPTISMRTVPEIIDAAVRNYEILKRFTNFVTEGRIMRGRDHYQNIQQKEQMWGLQMRKR